MACGKPVITTTNTVAPEIMTNGKDGLIIAPNNVKQLAEKIDYLLSNPDIAKKIGKEASRTIRRKNLTWKNCAKQIYERYISILNR
jgi:glycosyltransferase involved in cell wall biosynthesis